MKAKADGLLRHCFFGTYVAIIALGFETEHEAKSALPKLGAGWKIGDVNPKALRWEGGTDALEDCKKVLGKFGADVSKIDSCVKSIDYGEDFSVEFEIVPEAQLSLL